MAGLVAVAGMVATVWLLPEPKGKSLEEFADEAHAVPALRPTPAVA